jgi:hypothetical protein
MKKRINQLSTLFVVMILSSTFNLNAQNNTSKTDSYQQEIKNPSKPSPTVIRIGVQK